MISDPSFASVDPGVGDGGGESGTREGRNNSIYSSLRTGLLTVKQADMRDLLVNDLLHDSSSVLVSTRSHENDKKKQ